MELLLELMELETLVLLLELSDTLALLLELLESETVAPLLELADTLALLLELGDTVELLLELTESETVVILLELSDTLALLLVLLPVGDVKYMSVYRFLCDFFDFHIVALKYSLYIIPVINYLKYGISA